MTKAEAWNDILGKLNSSTDTPRQLAAVKKKWIQIKSAALKKNSSNLNLTGGGKGVELSEAEQLIIDFLAKKKSSQISGISGGGDILSAKLTDVTDEQLFEFDDISSPILVSDVMFNSAGASNSNNQNYPTIEMNDLNLSFTKEKRKVEDKPTGSVKKQRKESYEEIHTRWLKSDMERIELEKKKLNLQIQLLKNKLNEQ